MHRNVTYLGHSFNCCMSFAKDVSIRKGDFIQCITEIATELNVHTLYVTIACCKYMTISTMVLIDETSMVKIFYICVKYGI